MNVTKPPWYTVALKGLFPETFPDNLSLNDAIDDLKIPEFKTRDIQRYKDADNFFKQELRRKTVDWT